MKTINELTAGGATLKGDTTASCPPVVEIPVRPAKPRKKRLGDVIACEDCGAEIIRTTYNRCVCPSCARIRRIARVATNNARRRKTIPLEDVPRQREHNVKSPPENPPLGSRRLPQVAAKCPLCEKMHQVRMNPPANGFTPRIYCDACRPRVHYGAADPVLNSYHVGFY